MPEEVPKELRPDTFLAEFGPHVQCYELRRVHLARVVALVKLVSRVLISIKPSGLGAPVGARPPEDRRALRRRQPRLQQLQRDPIQIRMERHLPQPLAIRTRHDRRERRPLAMEARRYHCTIITFLAPQDPQVVYARPLDELLADGLRGPAFVAREAPRRLRGALGEALVVVGLAEEAVAVPVGALVCHYCLRCSPSWCGAASLGAARCAFTRKALDRCASRRPRYSLAANYFAVWPLT